MPLLDLSFNHQTDPPLLYHRIGLPREIEESDSPEIRTHPPVPFLKDLDHHLRYCPRPSSNVEVVCQLRQANNIKCVQVLRANPTHHRSIFTEEFFLPMVLSPSNGQILLWVLWFFFIQGRYVSEIQSPNFSFHHLTIPSVEVNRIPSLLYTGIYFMCAWFFWFQ